MCSWLHSLCPNRAATWSPGLPPRLPWEEGGNASYRNAVVPALWVFRSNDATALRLIIVLYCLNTQRSRNGNVGLGDVAPLGHHGGIQAFFILAVPLPVLYRVVMSLEIKSAPSFLLDRVLTQRLEALV